MKKTLIVEDHADTRHWLAAIVDRAFAGAECHFADSVAAAKYKLATARYDLAIIDLGLPDGSGVDVIQHISDGYPDIMAVVATIFDDDHHLIPALQAGAKGYVIKDQPEAALERTLSGLARGEPPLSPVVAQRILSLFVGAQPALNDIKTEVEQSDSAQLTSRETQVLEIIARGAIKQEVANSLNISENTVRTHVKSIYRKLGIASKSEATIAAQKLGLL